MPCKSILLMRNLRVRDGLRAVARLDDGRAMTYSSTREYDLRGFCSGVVRFCYTFSLDTLVKMVSNKAPITGIILLLALCTGGCGMPKRQFASLTGLGDKLSLQVTTSNGANQNSPVAMDVVLVSDKKLLGVLDKLSASDWFQKRAQIELDHPGKIQVLTDLQLVPGQRYGPVKLKFNPRFVAGILFANYFTPGAHRAVIDIHKPLVVNLKEGNFTLQTNH